MHHFSALFGKGLYMFRTDLLSIIRSLNTVFTAIGMGHTGYVLSMSFRVYCVYNQKLHTRAYCLTDHVWAFLNSQTTFQEIRRQIAACTFQFWHYVRPHVRCSSLTLVSEATRVGSNSLREQLDAHVVYKSRTSSPTAHKCYNMRTFPGCLWMIGSWLSQCANCARHSLHRLPVTIKSNKNQPDAPLF
jgi:hypothetical protein